MRVFVSGAAIFIAGLLLIFWVSIVGAMVALAGAGLAGVALSRYALYWRQIHRRLDRKLRIEPGVTSISVVDHLEATAKLDRNQQYTVTPVTAAGELVVDAEWGDAARTGVRQYCRRRRLSDAAKQIYWAGAVLLSGPVGFDIDSKSKLRIFRSAMLPLHGKVEDHEFLNSHDGHGRRSWRATARYVITPDPAQPWGMPIWLTPSIVPGSDRRILDLDVQWAKFGPGRNGLSLGSIEKLRINVPDEWGPVLDSTEYALVSISSGSEAGRRVIEWRPIPDVPHAARGRYRFSLRFQGRIRPEDFIRGEAVARFRGNLCRVEHVDLHGPDGERRDHVVTKRYTRVRLKFDLSLAAVDYEAVRVLPRYTDPTQPDASDRPQHVFDRVVPDSASLARVMGALSDADYYVKRVVENPPGSGKAEAVINRYWDVSGRKYNGLYPIDFHLILSGQELHDGGTVTAGRTEMALSVRGAYTDDVVDQLVHDEWSSLRQLVVRALKACAQSELRRWSAGSTRELLARLLANRQISPQVADRLETAIHDEFGATSQRDGNPG